MSKKNHSKLDWLTCFGIIILFLVPYGIVNHLPLARHTIPFILGENKIPFLPWTFIIYISVFLQGAIIVRHFPQWFLRKALVIAGSMILVGLIVFLFSPIEYPRELYPSVNGWITFFRTIDGSGNCFPSLHIATTVLFTACYGLFETSSKKRLLMWIWTIAIAVSVLTTKQHYLVDVMGGITLAIPFIYITRKEFFRDKVQKDGSEIVLE